LHLVDQDHDVVARHLSRRLDEAIAPAPDFMHTTYTGTATPAAARRKG